MSSELCPSCFQTDYWDRLRQECRFCGWSPDVALDEGEDWSDLDSFDEPDDAFEWV